MKLPGHRNLSIEHNCHKADGESLSQWLQQLQPEPSDFPSAEAQQRAIRTDELWSLIWEDSHGPRFLLAPTFLELVEFARTRVGNRMIYVH